MRIIKRLILILFAIFIVLIAAAISIPFIFKGKIVQFVKEKANEELKAELAFEDVQLSLIRSFPKLSVNLEKFLITDRDSLATFDTIIFADNSYLSLNLKDLWNNKEDIKIKSFEIANAQINLFINKDGKANYDIYMDPSNESDQTAPESESFKNIELESYKISNSDIRYSDLQSDVKIVISSLDHEGQGKFDLASFDFDTETQMDGISMILDGIPYLNNVKVDSKIKLYIDTKLEQIELKENFIQLNDFKINSEGDIQYGPEHVQLNLNFNSPQTEFKHVLSLIPAIYSKEFESLDTKGQFDFSGFAKGQLGPGDLIPSFNFELNISDGYFKYDGLSQSIDHLESKVLIKQNGNQLDAMTISIDPLSLNIGSEKTNGSLYLSHLMSNPSFKGKFTGALIFDEINDLIYYDGLDLKGDRLDFDLDFDGNYNSILREAYDQIQFNGTSSANNLNIQYLDYPMVQINQINTDFSPEVIYLNEMNILAGSSDFQGKGEVTNPLSFIIEGPKPNMILTANSKTLNIDEWYSSSTSETTKELTSENDFKENTELPINLNLDYKAQRVKAMDYAIDQFTTRATFYNDELKLQDVQGVHEGMNFKLNGELKNVMGYVNNQGALIGELIGNLGRIDLNSFMSESDVDDTNEKQDVAYAFSLPENIHLDMNFSAKELIFEEYQLKNTKLKSQLMDRKLIIHEAIGESFGGELGLKGIVNTPVQEKPKVDINYSMRKIDFQDIFNKVNSFQKLAPLAKYIDGSFNMDLDFSGLLNEDLMFDLSSIDANGFLQTINGYVQGFEPFQNLANRYNIKELKGYELKNTKNWLTIENGKVYIKEFTRKIGDNEYIVKGNHSINQEIDYSIRTSIPREKLDKTGVNKGIDAIAKEANKLGLNINPGDFIDVEFRLIGAINNPKIDFKVLGISSADGTKSTTGKLKEGLEQQAKEKVEESKENLQKKLEEEKRKREEELQKRLEEEKKKLDEEKRKKEEELKKKLEEEKRKKEEELRRKAEEEKEKLKKKLEDLNPFKKK